MIGKILSSVFFVLGVILFVASFTTLYFYDAEENSVKTLTDGVVEVEKGNEGYRVYTKHSCEDLEIDIYYESLFDRGNLVWDKSCSGGLLEFRPAASGDWNYVGTITFEQYSQYTSEVKIDFNISASHGDGHSIVNQSREVLVYVHLQHIALLQAVSSYW